MTIIIIMIVIRKNYGFVDDSSGALLIFIFYSKSSHTIDELKKRADATVAP